MKKLLPFVFAAATLAGCGSHPVAPASAVRPGVTTAQAAKSDARFPLTIQYVTANGMMGTSFTAPPNYPIQFYCYTMGSGMLQFIWNAFGPIFNFGAQANWTTPSTEGLYTVQVWVSSMETHEQAFQTLYVNIRNNAKLGITTLTDAEKATAHPATPYKH